MTLLSTVVTTAAVILGIDTIYWALTRRARLGWLPRRRSSPLVTAVVVATLIGATWLLDAAGLLDSTARTSIARVLLVAFVVALQIATVVVVGLLWTRRSRR